MESMQENCTSDVRAHSALQIDFLLLQNVNKCKKILLHSE